MAQQRYVSTELTHFVGRSCATDAQRYELLKTILRSGKLAKPGTSSSGGLHINTDASLCDDEMYDVEMVCFCDIPVGDLEIHMGKYSRFGLSLSKEFLTLQGACPVWYVAKNSLSTDFFDPAYRVEPAGLTTMQEVVERGNLVNQTINTPEHAQPRRIERKATFDRMLRIYHELFREVPFEQVFRTPEDGPKFSEQYRLWQDALFLRQFLDFEVFSFIKCFDANKSENDPDNFYMEREWRVRGHVTFTIDDVQRIILPTKDYARQLREDLPAYYGQVTFVE